MPRVRKPAPPLAACALLQLMWLASPALPVGGFSYSEVLEAAVEANVVHDEASALHWLRDTMSMDDTGQWRQRLAAILGSPAHGVALRADLADGMPTLPAWMQELLRPLVSEASSE